MKKRKSHFHQVNQYIQVKRKLPMFSYRFTTKPRFDVLDPVSLPMSTDVERRPLLSILTGA